MTNYPITDPAEIAKLPPAVYETGLGAMCLSDDGVWTDFAGDRWSHTDLASSGGIAGRLVPEDDPVRINEAYRLAVQKGRKIYPDQACEGCRGLGIKVYGSGSTWRGGIGAAAMTPGVCDKCWGSGNKHHPWPSHREAEQAEAQRDRAVELLRQIEHGLSPVIGFLRVEEHRHADKLVTVMDLLDAYFAEQGTNDE